MDRMQGLFSEQFFGSLISQVSSPMVNPAASYHLATQQSIQPHCNLSFPSQTHLNVLSNFASQQQQQLCSDINKAIGGLVNQSSSLQRSAGLSHQQAISNSADGSFVPSNENHESSNSQALSRSHQMISNNSESQQRSSDSGRHHNLLNKSNSRAANKSNLNNRDSGGVGTQREGSFICPLCSRSYTYRHGLTQHMHSHLSYKKFSCSQCGKDFVRKFQLDRHMKVHAKGMETFECKDCSKVFHHQESYLMHVKSHSHTQQSASHHCDICQATFSSKSDLMQHRREEHHCLPDDSANLLLSSMAGVSNSKPSMNSALSLASPIGSLGQRSIPQMNHGFGGPFPCYVCGKRFLDRYGLKRHFRTHSGERPHDCNICGMNFIEVSHMKQHMLTHTNETPYHCVVCARGFNRKYSYQRHLKWHAKSTQAPAALTAHIQEALGLMPTPQNSHAPTSSSTNDVMHTLVNSTGSHLSSNFNSDSHAALDSSTLANYMLHAVPQSVNKSLISIATQTIVDSNNKDAAELVKSELVNQ